MVTRLSEEASAAFSDRHVLTDQRKRGDGMGDTSPTPFDDVFKTLVNDTPRLLLFFVNEMFKGVLDEVYDGTEKVEHLKTEDIQNLPGKEQVTKYGDSRFKVFSEKERTFHIECQSSVDGTMALRIFEYDYLAALDNAKNTHGYNQGEVFLRFPHSGLLYLRSNSKTPEKITTHLITPSGELIYTLPVVKLTDYTVEMIIEKKLYFLIPFYIFAFLGDAKDGAGTEELAQEREAEILQSFQKFTEFLDNSELSGIIETYEKQTIFDMLGKVVNNVKVGDNIRKEISMGGKILDYEAKQILNRGKELNAKETNIRLFTKVQEGKITLSDAAEVAGISEKEFADKMLVCGYQLP